MKVYQKIASTLAAIENCHNSVDGNPVWTERHETTLAELLELMPSGSGFDNGTKLDDESTFEKLIFNTSFHHMDSNGSYCGWSDHTVTITASLLHGFTMKISGRNVRDIKDYIGECFESVLSSEV